MGVEKDQCTAKGGNRVRKAYSEEEARQLFELLDRRCSITRSKRCVSNDPNKTRTYRTGTHS